MTTCSVGASTETSDAVARFRIARLQVIVVSLLASLSLLVPVALSAPAQAAPTTAPPGFGARLVGPFPSDVPPGGTYIPELDGFTALREHHPDVIAQNLRTVIDINHSATRAERSDAIAVNYDDRLVSLSYALGDRVGGEFRTLLAAGKLPKVKELAGGNTARAGIPLGTTLIEKDYFNNPRPFEVAPRSIIRYDRPGGTVYSDVAGNGSYPSGHTNMGYWKAALLASWLPELGPQIIARAGDIGRSRIVLGVHYPLDVMGGRLMGMAIASERLSDPAFAPLIREAGDQLRRQLTLALGEPVSRALAADPTVLSTQDAVTAHRADMTYDFTRVTPGLQSTIPASAAALLRSRFPRLTDAQRLNILQRTAIRSGYPLDKTGPDGGWVRIDLAAAYAAAP